MNLTVFRIPYYLGDIMSDLSSRRGHILGQSDLGGGIEEIRAQVPHHELLKYAIDLPGDDERNRFVRNDLRPLQPDFRKNRRLGNSRGKEFMKHQAEDE